VFTAREHGTVYESRYARCHRSPRVDSRQNCDDLSPTRARTEPILKRYTKCPVQLLAYFFFSTNTLVAVVSYSSIAGLVVITVERYVKIVHSVVYRNHYRRWMTYAGVILPWADGFCTQMQQDNVSASIIRPRHECRRVEGTGTHTHTHPFNGPFSVTTRVGRYHKGKTNLDFTEARDSEWQWHQLDGPYANLHIAPDRQRHLLPPNQQHQSTDGTIEGTET